MVREESEGDLGRPRGRLRGRGGVKECGDCGCSQGRKVPSSAEKMVLTGGASGPPVSGREREERGECGWAVRGGSGWAG